MPNKAKKSSTKSATGRNERTFWSENNDFPGLVKGFNALVRLEHARQNWSTGLPAAVDKLVGRVFDSIRLPNATPWLTDNLNKLKGEMGQQLNQLVTTHLAEVSRDVTSSVQLLDQRDVDVAKQTAVRQLRKTHGNRIKQKTIDIVLSNTKSTVKPTPSKQTANLVSENKKKRPAKDKKKTGQQTSTSTDESTSSGSRQTPATKKQRPADGTQSRTSDTANEAKVQVTAAAASGTSKRKQQQAPSETRDAMVLVTRFIQQHVATKPNEPVPTDLQPYYDMLKENGLLSADIK